METQHTKNTTSTPVATAAAKPKRAAKPERAKRTRARAIVVRVRGENRGAHLRLRGHGVWYLYWPDPHTGALRCVTTATRDERVARGLLALKVRELTNAHAVAVERHALGLPPPAPSLTIEDALRSYHDYLCRAPNRPSSTVYGAERGINLFLEFVRARALTFLSELDEVALAGFYASLLEAPGRGGGRVKVSTVNQWVKPVRTALRRANAGLRSPVWSDHFLSQHLPHIPVAKSDDRELHAIDHARAMERAPLKAALQALLEAPKYRAAAIDVSLLLLYGLRRRELVQSRVAHIRENNDGLDLPGAICKGFRSRKVPSKDFTVIGQELLEVLRDGHAASEWLSEGAYSTLGEVFGRFGIRGHDLRATCATYQLSLPVSPKFATARLGHTLQVADESYFALLDSQPKQAATLEEAMGLEREFSAVVELARERAVFPRTRRRSGVRHTLRGVAKL